MADTKTSKIKALEAKLKLLIAEYKQLLKATNKAMAAEERMHDQIFKIEDKITDLDTGIVTD